MIVRAIGWAVAALAILAAIGIGSTRPPAYDLVAYTDAARRLLAGDPLYPLAARETIFLGAGEYLYPPLTAVLFIPLALVPLELARALWTAGLVALAAALGLVLTRSLPSTVRPWALACYALYLPLVAEITLGNLNLVTLALCLAAWRARDRAVAGGALLAAAVGLKLVPIALPVFFLAAGRARLLVWAAALGISATLLSFIWLADEWRTYAGLALGIAAAPATQAVALAPSDVPVRVVLLLAALALLTFAGRAARDPSHEHTAFSLALAAMLLAAPAIWYPYLVFALPLFAVLARAPAPMWIVALVAWAALQIPARGGEPPIAFAGLVLLIAAGVAHIVRVTRSGARVT